MLERNRLLESDMIMLIRTFHHAHVVRSIQGNQYRYVIMEPKSFVSPRSLIVPGEVYCHNEHVRMGKKNLLIKLQDIKF